jgi:mono/diheme cytochrome c family protein
MRKLPYTAGAISLTMAFAGCQPGLSNQPRVSKPDSASSFFADGQSNRPPVPGAIARGQLDNDSVLFTGKSDDQYVRDIPLPITEALVLRGQERFNINCAQCHDRTGTGNGKVVSRGLIRPPSYQTDDSRGFKLRGQTIKLTEVPAGYIFDVIANGYGAMASHGELVAVDDRWAIIAYIRALQLTEGETKRGR